MCPLTIHALLHIADSIEMVGPVWAYWAFAMERYCGSLQPAIRSRRHPYASLNRYLVDQAHLVHLKLIYPGLEKRLDFDPTKDSSRTVSIQGCASSFNTVNLSTNRRLSSPDNTCILLYPRRTLDITRGLQDKILSCLCTTRYDIPVPHLRRLLPTVVQHWGKLRILPAGDTIRAASLQTHAEDRRDCTFVRVSPSLLLEQLPRLLTPMVMVIALQYEQMVDIHSRNHHVEAEFVSNTFYVQLQHIIVLKIPDSAYTSAEILLLGVIQACVIEKHDYDLDIHYYSRMGATEVVDIRTIQCAVGRIWDRNQWAIFDRSGDLARALYTEEPSGTSDPQDPQDPDDPEGPDIAAS